MDEHNWVKIYLHCDFEVGKTAKDNMEGGSGYKDLTSLHLFLYEMLLEDSI